MVCLLEVIVYIPFKQCIMHEGRVRSLFIHTMEGRVMARIGDLRVEDENGNVHIAPTQVAFPLLFDWL